jgi:hypothetical protein
MRTLAAGKQMDWGAEYSAFRRRERGLAHAGPPSSLISDAKCDLLDRD